MTRKLKSIALIESLRLIIIGLRVDCDDMDTLREKSMLEELWQSDQAPWKVWK